MFAGCLVFYEDVAFKTQHMFVSNSPTQMKEDIRSGPNKPTRRLINKRPEQGIMGADRKQAEKQHLQMRNSDVKTAAGTAHYRS